MNRKFELSELIESRAFRILFKLVRFNQKKNNLFTDEIPLRINEKILGAYENYPNKKKEIVIVTDSALHIYHKSAWSSIYYEQISCVETPSKHEKRLIEKLDLRLKSGAVETIPVRGGIERFRDAWEFLRFLNRVISDVNKYQYR